VLIHDHGEVDVLLAELRNRSCERLLGGTKSAGWSIFWSCRALGGGAPRRRRRSFIIRMPRMFSGEPCQTGTRL